MSSMDASSTLRHTIWVLRGNLVTAVAATCALILVLVALFGPALLQPQVAQETRAPLPLVEFAANPVLCAHLLGATATGRRGLLFQPVGADGDPGPLAFLAATIAAGETPLVAMTGAHSDDRATAVAALAGLLGCGVVRLTLTDEPESAALVRDGLLQGHAGRAGRKDQVVHVETRLPGRELGRDVRRRERAGRRGLRRRRRRGRRGGRAPGGRRLRCAARQQKQSRRGDEHRAHREWECGTSPGEAPQNWP